LLKYVIDPIVSGKKTNLYVKLFSLDPKCLARAVETVGPDISLFARDG